MRYLLIDTANTFFRARHSAHRASSPEEKVAFAIHVTLGSINKCYRDQRADHVVICLEGRSWRKDFYKPYKAQRAAARAAKTEAEAEEDRLFWAAFDDLCKFLAERTNCTVLQHPNLEADDLIAGWTQSHPEDHHTIISSDTDYIQLLADNINQYNGITDELHTTQGIYDKKGSPVLDKKTKAPKIIPDPAWLLFEKCVRGDASDNIFSAFPGVRTNGSKNKVGLREAFEDRNNRGFAWNNLMLQRWLDHEGVEHRVLDDYQRNVQLVDLTAQPDHIKAQIAETIASGSQRLNRPMVGVQFMKFCGRYDLVKISEQVNQYTEWLTASYPELEQHA
jgi:5'-3' exonuclease